MLTFVPFAAFSLEAPLQEIKDPSKLATLFSAKSTVRLVNVWATWCIPCVEEMGDLRDIANEFGPQVSIVGVSLDDMIPGDRAETKQHVIDFLQKKKVRFTNVYYRGNADALGEYLKFDGEIPITIAFDRNGKELWRHQGKIDRRQTIGTIKKLLRRTR